MMTFTLTPLQKLAERKKEEPKKKERRKKEEMKQKWEEKKKEEEREMSGRVSAFVIAVIMGQK